MESNSLSTSVLMKKYRERTANWSSAKCEVLREQCLQNYNILHGPISSSLTAEKKAKVWTEIAYKINAVGGSHRTSYQVKKKWTNLRSSSCKNVRQSNCQKNTTISCQSKGVSPPVPYTSQKLRPPMSHFIDSKISMM